VLQELCGRLNDLSDPVKAENVRRYFKAEPGGYGEGDRFLGIRVPVLRGLAKEYADLPFDDILRLLHTNIHEQRFLALLLLVQGFRKADPEGEQLIYEQYMANTARINNWDLVDVSAMHIVGPYLLERDKKILSELASSCSLWKRRIAIMATFHFIRQNRFETTLELAEILLYDREDLIHKAVGWMLREIGKRDQGAEEAFLQKHYRVMPRTMLRYAIENFPERLRKMYLRGEV